MGELNEMVLSRYLNIYFFPDRPGYLLLFSTKNASLALVPEEVVHALRQGNNIPADFEKTLTRLGMLVSDQDKEEQEVCRFLDEINRSNQELTVSIIPGLDCNFACSYCYEGSLKNNQAMTHAVADQLAGFVKKHFTHNKKRLVLDFYGGEPLLYTKLIKYISGALQPLAEERGRIFEFSLVTNGSLLTPKTVKELVPFGLKIVKITLDGSAETHNASRPFKSGKGSFETILANIEKCHDLVQIGIGGNFTKDNYLAFPALFDHLEAAGLTPDMMGQVGFSPAMQTNDAFSNPDFTGGCASCNEPWVAAAAVLLREETLKRGFKAPKIIPSPCMVDVEDGFVVNHDGKICKCVGLVGHEAFVVGDVKSGIRDYRHAYHLDNWKKNDACRECVYLPLCFGGCRYMKYQRDGDMSGLDCQKEFLDATLEKAIKQDVKYGHTI